MAGCNQSIINEIMAQYFASAAVVGMVDSKSTPYPPNIFLSSYGNY